jgi:hypothetical protein
MTFMEYEKGEKHETVSATDTQSSNKPDFITQIENAFANHLPENSSIDAFVEKIIDAYMIPPPHRNITTTFSSIL